jgi:hypothetical protein
MLHFEGMRMPMNPFTRASKPRWGAALAAFVLSTALAFRAQAMPNFPLEIQSHLGLSYAPSCTFCHATAQGGGPVTTKFGQAMQKAGLTTNVSTVGPALDALNASHTDSDGNGTPDIQQIESGEDPNTGSVTGPTERYGCGAHVAMAPVRFSSAALSALALTALVFVRRRGQLESRGSPKDRTNNS